MAMAPAAPGMEDGFVPLARALALPAHDRDAKAIATMACYVARDLTRDHPDLGRSGAVCPYAAGAVRRDCVAIGASALDRLDEPAMRAEISRVRGACTALIAAAAPRDRVYCAALLAFPHLPEGGAALVERMQREAKADFVRDGLMIGEFYPGCATPGLHSPRFRPFDAPVVTLAVREMTALDRPFMTGNPGLMASFERLFGGTPRAPRTAGGER